MFRASVLFALAACGGGGGFPVDAAPDSPAPGGRFSLAWTVNDADGNPIPCSQVGAQVVSLTLRNFSQAGGFSEAFSCNSLMATSQPFPPGIYEIQFKLTGTAGELAIAPTQQNVMLVGNQTTELEALAFQVDATGALSLRLNTNQAGGNCAGGAGIQNTTIALRHTDNTCEPVTFQISAGATQPAGTYTVNCDAPQLAPCIDSDQTLTASPLPSGNYRIQVRGRIGGTDCWTNDDTLAVPPLGGTLDSTLNLIKAPGC